MKIALLQQNYLVGDFEGNSQKIIQGVLQASELGASLCITSEMSLWGYPPKDLLLKKSNHTLSQTYLHKIASNIPFHIGLILGVPQCNTIHKGKPLWNSAVFLAQGKIQQIFHKTLLPHYDVFNEKRYFESNPTSNHLLIWKEQRIGITICEDIWNDKEYDFKPYGTNPLEYLSLKNLDFLINISASPFTVGKHQKRYNLLSNISNKYSIPIIYVNQVGGNDDLVFDGRSAYFNQEGNLLQEAKAFEEDIIVVDSNNQVPSMDPSFYSPEQEIWNALVLGTKDYVLKSGFKKVLLGLSGGIDSALTATIATVALGKENVKGILMPSPFSSKSSIEDAISLANNLEIDTEIIPISPIMESFEEALKPSFENLPVDTTEENIQSRIRGNLLMALSNKYHALLLTTGNKSELAVGYCTIYGDMVGALGVISDLPKQDVFKLCKWWNQKNQTEIIPKNTIEKPPSAELKPSQKDQDTLPDYTILDDVLSRYIEQYQGTQQIIQETQYSPDIVKKIIQLVNQSEFKRRQAAPGIKIKDRAFGTGWKMPLACKILE